MQKSQLLLQKFHKLFVFCRTVIVFSSGFLFWFPDLLSATVSVLSFNCFGIRRCFIILWNFLKVQYPTLFADLSTEVILFCEEQLQKTYRLRKFDVMFVMLWILSRWLCWWRSCKVLILNLFSLYWTKVVNTLTLTGLFCFPFLKGHQGKMQIHI